MDYAGKDTCAGDSMCATKCPVGIDTGALVKDLRSSSLSDAERRVGVYLSKHFATVMSSARATLVCLSSRWAVSILTVNRERRSSSIVSSDLLSSKQLEEYYAALGMHLG